VDGSLVVGLSVGRIVEHARPCGLLVPTNLSRARVVRIAFLELTVRVARPLLTSLILII